jgi:hypothetical protein
MEGVAVTTKSLGMGPSFSIIVHHGVPFEQGYQARAQGISIFKHLEIKEKKEPVPKLIDCALNAHGFGTGFWKKRPKVRFFLINLR